MNHRLNRLLIFGTFLTFLATPFICKTQTSGDQALQQALDDWAKADQHHGVSASVIFNNGEQWTSTAGEEAAGKPLKPEHLIWIASITKTMTGAVILQLVSEGKLGLDDPIKKWLSSFKNVDPEITVKQLLNHTNGLANYTRSPALGQSINEDIGHKFTPEELISFIGPKSFEKGARTQYTNSSFLILGMIAEKVTGSKITELYQQRLWSKLNLPEIFLPGVQQPTGPVAKALDRRGQVVEPLTQMSLLTIGYSAFGLYANARTVARWGRTLFSEDFLPTDIREAMLTFVPAAGNIPGESGAGLGIRKYNFLDREQWGHSGGSPLGSSLMVYDPTTGITVAVIMNQGPRADHFRLVPKLLKISAATNK